MTPPSQKSFLGNLQLIVLVGDSFKRALAISTELSPVGIAKRQEFYKY